MFDKLEAVEERYLVLERMLADPDVISRRAEFQKLSKEHADLAQLVAAFREYKRLTAELDANKELLDEKDAELKAMAREEQVRLTGERDGITDQLKLLLLPKDPADDKNIVLEIRGGTGGEEAALFAADLFRMYTRYAERRGWRVELISASETDGGGFKEVVAGISGKDVFGHLRYESGVHRVQRVPETEAQGRVHTSTATVAVLPEAEEADVQIDGKDLRIDVMRASGAGGQHVNRTESAVRITHLPTGLVVVCQDEKSQHKNKARAMTVLRSRLYDLKQQQLDAERSAERRGQIGSGERSEKIRTYNFPQNRVTDHRIGLTLHRLDRVIDGDLDEIVEALALARQGELAEAG
jgi:peptide chain release factor 1